MHEAVPTNFGRVIDRQRNVLLHFLLIGHMTDYSR